MGTSEESKVLVALSELKGQIGNLSKDLRSLEGSGLTTRESVEALRRDMNGRFKKLEHAIFGNEEVSKIGLIEKVRGLEAVGVLVAGDETRGMIPLTERVRNLESGWAKLTTAAVIACSILVEGAKWAGHMIYAALMSGKTHQ